MSAPRSEIDEFSSQGSMIVAATNLSDSLDFALWRRFDDTIFMDKPDSDIIKKLLSEYLAIEIDAVLPRLADYSHCDVVKICQKAMKIAFFESREVCQEDLIDVIDVISKRKRSATA